MKFLPFLTVLGAAVAIGFGAAGCATPPEIPLTPISPEMRERAAAMREALAPLPLHGVALMPEAAMLYHDREEALVERLKLLGYNRLYLVIKDVDMLNEDFTDMVTTARRSGLECEILAPQRFFMPQRTGNVVQRKWSDPDPLQTVAGKIRKFNAALPDDAKLGGVTVSSDIHIYTLKSEVLPSNIIYLWGDNSYGIGRDNDILIRQQLVKLSRFRDTVGTGLPLTVIIPDFYHDRTVAGDLSCGKVTDFLKVASRVVVNGAGGRPTEFSESIKQELQSADAPGRVLIGVNLAGHSSEMKMTLRRRDWADFVKIIGYLSRTGHTYPACGGMLAGPYRAIELLWEN